MRDVTYSFIAFTQRIVSYDVLLGAIRRRGYSKEMLHVELLHAQEN